MAAKVLLSGPASRTVEEGGVVAAAQQQAITLSNPALADLHKVILAGRGRACV